MRFVKTPESLFFLPSGFTRVEYLQSSGTQYIDTGIKGKNNIDFDYRCIFTNLDGTAQCVGGNWSGAVSSTVSLYLGLIRTNGNFAYHYDGTQSPAVVMNTTVQYTPYSIQGHMWAGEQYMVINGTKSSVGTISSTFTSTLNMYLFGLNNNGLANPAYMKLYYCKIWDDGVLVRDFIPCIDPLGVACMYDLVGKKAYYNQGTGDDFTVGRQIIPVEYIQSSGTQYIDTDYIPQSNVKIETDFQLTEIPSYTFATLCGSLPTNQNYSGLFVALNYTVPIQARTGSNSNPNVISTYSVNTDRYKLSLEFNKLTINGDVFTPTTLNTWYNLTNPLYFFSCSGYDQARRRISAKMWYFKVYAGDTLVRNLIPCKDENNVGFMFDTVSGTVYLNAGTGAFSIGNNKYKMKLRLIKDNILPTGYTQVEYLESTGTQYIDTGIKSSANMSIKIKFNLVNVSSAAVFGSYSGSPSNGVGVFFGTAGGNISGKVYCNNTNIAVSPDLTLSTNTDYEIEMSDTTVVVNDSTYTSAITASNNYNMALFARSNNGTIERQISGKVYYYRAYDNDTLVHDFIPALDPSGTPCMYDLVTRTPFYNAGTGTFTTGKPVLPMVRFPADPIPGYKTVNYLESTGTQYIDTGVILSSTDKVEALAEYTGAPTQGSSYIFGTYGGSKNFGINATLQSSSSAFYGVWYNQGTITASTPKPEINTKYKIEVSSNGIYINDTLFNNVSGTFTGSNIAYLFWANGTSQPKSIMRLYYVKIWNNNTLVRNFIPVVRLLDNKAGMWDTVTKQFYTTSVGDFITG